MYNGNITAELFENAKVIAGLFKTAVELSAEDPNSKTAVKAILKKIAAEIEENVSEKKMHEIFDRLEMSDQQRSHFFMILINYDRALLEGNKPDDIIRPKWMLIDKIIHQGQRYLRKHVELKALLDPGKANQKLLQQPATAHKTATAKEPATREKNITEQDLLRKKEEIEKWFDSDYEILISATKRYQQYGHQFYDELSQDFDNINILPSFMGLHVDEYQKVLTELGKYRDQVMMSPEMYKKLKELYNTYRDYLPKWTAIYSTNIPDNPIPKQKTASVMIAQQIKPVEKEMGALPAITII